MARKAAKNRASARLQIGCIINPQAGSAGADQVTMLKKLFARRGLSPKFVEFRHGNLAGDLIQQLIQDGCNVVIAGGGDGTVNAVASALVKLATPDKRQIPLGILPLGTLNHFARDLKIPFELGAAVDVIADAEMKTVDIGEVNGRLFLNNSSLGLYPAIVRLREALQKAGHGKWRAFARATLAVLFRFPKLRLEIASDGRPPALFTTPLLFVGNNRFETGLADIGMRQSLDRGCLWIMSPKAFTRTGFLVAALALVAKAREFDVVTFEAKHILIQSNRPRLMVALDGEVGFFDTPLRYRIRPGCLTVIAPSAGPAPGRDRKGQATGRQAGSTAIHSRSTAPPLSRR